LRLESVGLDDAIFAAGTPEVEIDRQDGMPIKLSGEIGKMANLALTNDRILFVHQKFGTGGSESVAGMAIAAMLQGRSEQKAGGPREIVRLAEVRGGRLQHRRLLLNLYELTLTDGSTCRMHRKLRKKWDATIRRLVTERHGAAIVEDGKDGWRTAAR
jgi:hypothetical protein